MELSRDEVRRPDVVTAELKKGFEWTTQHSQAVGIAALVLIVAGVGWSAWSYMQSRQETALQEKYYQAEHGYLEKKEKFDLYQSTANRPVDPKTKAAPAPEGVKASGDLAQDFGPEIAGFEAIVKESPKTKAAALAALTLSKIYGDYQKRAEAIEILKQASDAPAVLGLMVRTELGTQLANDGKCQEAIDQWATVAKNSKAEFMLPQVKLKMGLCSESLGKKDQAEGYYRDVVASAKDSAAGKSAEKYLGLLKSQTAP